MKKLKWLKYIKVQIALYYLLTSVILVSVFGIALYYSIANIVLNETLETTISAVERSGNYVEVYIDKLKTIADIIAQNPSTTAYLGEHDNSKHDDVLAIIGTAIASDPYIESIIMVSKDGRILSNEAELDMTMSEDMMNESWYVAAINSDMPVLTSARMQDFSMDKEHWVISISQEVTDAKGNNIGVLLLDIKYLVLEAYIETLALGDEGFVFILNDAGEVVYHKDTSYFTDSKKQAVLVEMTAMDGYDPDLDMLTHPYHLKNADWTLVGVSSLDGLQVIRRQMIEILVVVGLI
jgi:two-component system sensor histidine kinase YesM